MREFIGKGCFRFRRWWRGGLKRPSQAINTMGRISYKTDAAFTQAWATRIGRLILNFAGLEFESYMWLLHLSEQPERIPEFAKCTFKQRVKKIMEYAETRAFSEGWKVDARCKWDDALELAKLRNRIAHNPLLFQWVDESEEGEPDLIGVADMQALGQPSAPDGPLLSKMDADATINRVAALVPQLESLRKDWCAIRDEKSASV